MAFIWEIWSPVWETKGHGPLLYNMQDLNTTVQKKRLSDACGFVFSSCSVVFTLSDFLAVPKFFKCSYSFSMSKFQVRMGPGNPGKS